MRAFDGTILFPIIELGISQLYLNEDKILGVTSWFQPEALEQYAPLPVHDFGNGRYTLTDGHSRAYVAYKHGLTHIPVIYDQDDLVTNPVGGKGDLSITNLDSGDNGQSRPRLPSCWTLLKSCYLDCAVIGQSLPRLG